MKVGIVTFHHAPSYGAFFQTYALVSHLQAEGHNVSVIDYMPAHRQHALQNSWARLSLRRLGLNRTNLVRLRGKRLFSGEVRRYLPLTKRTYADVEELRVDPPEIDVCVCGSDQIWNYELTGGDYDEAYFGTFVPPEVLRVAYAPSFGRRAPLEHSMHLRNCLAGLNSVSVREESGLDTVSSVAGRRDAELVLDPTLLIDAEEYPTAKVEACPREYVLIHCLKANQTAYELSAMVGKKLGVPVIDVKSAVAFWGTRVRPSPLQLLCLIKNARYVVTDSYHGLAMSLVYRRDFSVLPLIGPAHNRTERMTCLLGRLDLKDRFVSGDKAQSAACTTGPLDWGKVALRLQALRARSCSFLEGALRRTSPK
jgi:hypothetical protein